MPNEVLKRRAFGAISLALVLLVIDVLLIRAKTGPAGLLVVLTIIAAGYGGWMLWKSRKG